MPLSPRIVALSVSSKRSFLPQRQISVTLQSSPEKAYSAVVWKGIGLCRQRRRQVRDRAGEESELGKVMTACWWRRCRTLLYSWSILNNDGLPAVIRTAVELGGGILNIRVPLGMEKQSATLACKRPRGGIRRGSKGSKLHNPASSAHQPNPPRLLTGVDDAVDIGTEREKVCVCVCVCV
jgi:hypothetical protein